MMIWRFYVITRVTCNHIRINNRHSTQIRIATIVYAFLDGNIPLAFHLQCSTTADPLCWSLHWTMMDHQALNLGDF
jgi:hypothetical protein